MELQLKIIGILLVALAFGHLIFPKYFEWKKDLVGLTLINRQMMHVHTFFVAFTVFLMGVLCLSSARDIVTTELGKRIALGFGIFWVVRLYIQFFGYSPQLWKGKKLETIAHVIFTLLWCYLTVVFLWIFIE